MNGKAKKGLAQIQDTVGQSHGYLSSFAINILSNLDLQAQESRCHHRQ